MSDAPHRPRPRLGVFLLVAVPAVTGLILYLAVVSRGHIPDMPEIPLAPDGAAQSNDALTDRAADFHPTEMERAIIAQLEELHLTESDAETDAPTASVQKQTRDLSERLKKAVAADSNRFFRLGDFLALRFHRALGELLATPVSERGPRSLPLHRVTLFGGAFYRRAVARGLIGPDGALDVSPALPQILFRTRWRRLAGLEGDDGFTPYEKTALLDFTLRFVRPQETERRLAAARETAKMVPDFNLTAAEALIYFEADDTKSALAVLRRAESDGTADRTVSAFRRALEAK